MAKWKMSSIRARVLSTPMRLVNQIDSAEAYLDGAGTSEINDSPSRVIPAAPKCPHQFRENGGLFCCPVFDEFREQNRIETHVAGLRSAFGEDGNDPHPFTSTQAKTVVCSESYITTYSADLISCHRVFEASQQLVSGSGHRGT